MRREVLKVRIELHKRRNYIKEKSRMAAELKEIEFYLKSIGLANPKVKLVKYCLDKC
jgi:hypothetical protein